jgi:excinuclease ABC subunit B
MGNFYPGLCYGCLVYKIFPMSKFKLVSPFKPTGDQPQAIEKLLAGLKRGEKHQTLLGVTGSGKTFTMANIIDTVQKPTLVIAHNKTLAAQLCSEFKEFFPENAVSYFVSYYDYYQPEAYIPSSDTYIEKDASINEEINKFRHAATVNLLTRKDVLIVASVSCIYGLGDVEEYGKFAIDLKVGEERKRDKLLRQLSDIQYTRSSIEFKQGMFHVLGDTLEIFPPDRDTIFRLEFFGDEIEKISEADSFTGELIRELESVKVFPAKHDVTSKEKIERATDQIRNDMQLRYDELKAQGKLLEAERIKTRTEYDLEILQETGYVTGIENYTRYFSQRGPGSPPATLMDYFPDDYLLIVDESHMTIPQIGGMFNGNQSRKQTLVDYGFRLPSSHDNRPLKFTEFEESINQVIFVSATPSKYEFEKSKKNVVEQIIRPTGLIDPEVMVRPCKHQIDDLMKEIKNVIAKNERVLVTTLTKRSAEDLTDFLKDAGVRVRYLHSDIITMERIEILRDLRLGKFDVLVGINLLREGLDLPEVSFIGILDADKEGFLRSEGALIQTIGRCARNVNGRVVMYADRITGAMEKALSETSRRRVIQKAYNKKHGITPQTIIKAVKDIAMLKDKRSIEKGERHIDPKKVPREEMARFIRELEEQMDMASQNLEFEKAAELRDEIDFLREQHKM